MLGADHATCGAIAGVATLPAHHGLVFDAAWISAWSVAALWSDFDQSGSTASRTWGGATRVASGLLGRIVGGHRWGTHDIILAPAALYWLIVPAAMATLWSRYLLVALMLGLALRALLPRGTVPDLSNLFLSIGGAWWLVTHHYDNALPLGAILAWGVLVHALGDLLTPEGLPIPVVWIFTRRRIALPLFTTGSAVERVVVAPVLCVVLLLVLDQRVGLPWLPVHLHLLPAGVMPVRLPLLPA